MDTYIGILPDDRPEAEKARDYQFSELVSAPLPVAWREKKPAEWRRYPIYDQNGSGSCVAQTMSKLQSIYFHTKTGFYPRLSASHIYQRRANKPSGGMMGHDAFQIAQKGVTLEQFAPSEKMNDTQMDNVTIHPFMDEVGKAFAIGQYITVTPDIDTIASIIQTTGKGVMVWFYFNLSKPNREWQTVPQILVPDLNMYAPSTSRHSVTAVDFTLHKGKKALIIDDSWGLDAAVEGQRVITEDFFKARCYFAAHFMSFHFETTPIPPQQPNFEYDLELGMQGGEVKRLQIVLKMMGHFPANVEATGYYGNVTATAVGKFQEQQKIVQKGEAGYGRFGQRTRTALNSLI